ncbi:sugar ABC transporter substrate-binding protein [Tessaracoccus sp. OS52]|uniref:ABC transporter substrate-binding protein n=1 Tax=Tessaracoccus sp. OS52 TaxID=2886691 RepID=UPI001D12D72B|nr:sugar ABC transporter substrate-binding protein [Tessaracoccus sp. OS52]MCC2594470.1 sugar ABC transporter substrate-binding protein [Tessaracoccus sp. OS52]
MTKWKRIAAISLLTPLALAAAACGGDSGGNTDGATGDNAAEGSGTLTVWTWDPAFNIYAMEEAAKIYQQENPDVKVEVVETPWDDLQAKLTTLAQSQEFDELPDIFLMQNLAFQKNVINYPDLFSDFSDTDVDFSEFPEGVVAYSTVDGVNYGVPFDNGTAISALRTDVLEEAGYTVEDFTDITWSEFIEKGEDVLAKTGKPLASGMAGSVDLIMMMLQSAGASLFDEEGNPTIVGNEALLEAIDVYQRLVDSGVFVEVNSWDEFVGTFVNGNVAGVMQGVWILGSIQSAEDQAGKWGITNLPKLDNVENATHFSANGGSSWAISSSADKELAADFLSKTFAGSPELYDTILPASGAVANWLPAADSEVYAEPHEFFGGEPVFTKVIEYAEQVPSNNTGVYYYEGRDAVSAAITKIMGGADPNTALEEAQANVEFAMG